MKSRSSVFGSALVAALLVTDSVESKSIGVLPHTTVGLFNVGSLTRTSAQSCGQCHRSTVGAVAVTVAPVARVLPVNQTTNIVVTGTSSVPGSSGGFTADVTRGTLIGDTTTTRTSATGTAITHRTPLSRSWTFGWKAPATPGLAEFHTVVATVNGNGAPDPLDRWAFHGANPTNGSSTPVRLYALPSGVKATGTSCADGQGNYSVLGATGPATIGKTFTMQGFGLPPSSPLLFMLSIGANFPGFDLQPLGAPGCVLRTALQLQVILATGPGDVSRSEGSLALPVPIPNDTALRGLVFVTQYGVIDPNSKRAFPMVLTNGLEVTIQ